MSKFLVSTFAVATFGLFGGSAAAAIITLTPTTNGVTYLDIGASNQEPELFGFGTAQNSTAYAGYTTDTTTLNLLYKSDFGGSDSGTFSASYSTVFSPATEPSNATITWSGPGTITCPECYLAIKDGAFGYYTFNLNDLSVLTGQGLSGAWNGTDQIVMTGFWAGTQGAISHVAFWGRPGANGNNGGGPGNGNGNGNTVPEPGTLALMGGALFGLWAVRRRKET